MKTTLSFSRPSEVETECLAVVIVDQGEKDKPAPTLLTTDEALKNAAAELTASGEVSGKIFETVLIHRPQGIKAKRLLLVGGGKAKNFSGHELRKLAGTAVRFLKPKQVRSFSFLAPELPAGAADAVKAVVQGAFVGNFDPDIYKSDRKDQRITEITIVVPPGADRAPLETAVNESRILGESQNFTRELVNEPSNRLTPTALAERARKMAEEINSPHFKCETYGADKIKELKMGAFWSVAQGSEEPPALIVLRWSPPDAPEKPVLGLVGKGITFDSGGISIKPSDGMEKMKYDMAGGAAMLGAMRAIALLQPKVKVIAVVCATENMPSGRAQKPGDVQIAMSGKSIEIINTDAEGRLVLADALAYTEDRFKPRFMIDLATLTGAIMVALGHHHAGMFSTDDALAEALAAAGEATGDRVWRMPLGKEYDKQINSKFADVKNVGGRDAGAITAAQFLKRFVKDTPWVHLDVAGTAIGSPQTDVNRSWASGWGVRLLDRLVADKYER